MPAISFKENLPRTASGLFLAPDAWLIGNVEVAANVSIFFGAVLRGDIEKITIGENSNIQEHSVFHTSEGKPCSIGRNVTVGHRALLHGCTVKDDCLIGMGSTILDGAVIEPECIIGANSLVSMNTIIPKGSLAYGSPARVVRTLKPGELEYIKGSAQHYVEKGREYIQIF